MVRMTAQRLALRRHPGVRQAARPKARNGIIPQWDLIGRLRLNPRASARTCESAPPTCSAAARPSLILAVRNPATRSIRSAARSTSRARRGATRRPAGRRRPGPGRLAQGRLPEGHEGRQLHRHLVDHPGRQALHRSEARDVPALSRSGRRVRAAGPACTLESEVMEEIWGRGEATVRDVHEALNARGGKVRAYTTLLTVMTRLDAKGLLVRRRAGRLDVYAPALRATSTSRRAPRPRSRRSSRTSAISRSRTSRATSGSSTRSGWRSCAGWPTVTETAAAAGRVRGRRVRRSPRSCSRWSSCSTRCASTATCSWRPAGLPRGEVHVRGLLLLALALFDVFALTRALALARGAASSAHRRVARGCRCSSSARSRGRPVVDRRRARARWRSAPGCCARACIVSEGALERLGDDASWPRSSPRGPSRRPARPAADPDRARDRRRLLAARAAAARAGAGRARGRRRGRAPRRRRAAGRGAAGLRRRRDRARARGPARGRAAARPGAARAGGRRGGRDRGAGGRCSRSGVLIPGHPRFCLPLASAPVWIAVRGDRALGGDGARPGSAGAGRAPSCARCACHGDAAGRCLALLVLLAVAGDLRCACGCP